uniref:Schwann cell myelin protein-like isoform X3 n=1 Tax=Scatophagus argus TaxID=75038 RepID=UPI001ED7DF73|nr:Schwann cell myelin protein-like isoform X3 [Scatophagus argus]
MYDLQTSCLTRLTKMAAALTLLFIGCLLQDVMCGGLPEKVIMPQAIDALRGSCVTIPCSFEVRREYNVYLDQTCEALWKTDANTIVFNSSNPQSSTIKGHFTGNLRNKDCTTTLNNMQPAYNNNNYYLRVECANTLKHNMDDQKLQISVRDDPPTPTLTPPTVRWVEGTLVSVRCSAPAPCLSLPPALTWTPHLGGSHETLQENLDKTKVKISTLTFNASHLHHRQNISCTAVYTKQDCSTESSATTSLTADISYSPKHTSVSVSPSGPVPKNSTVTLTCSTTANPAVVTYTWYRTDGGQGTFIGTGHVLNITASEVRSSFFCKAENNVGAGRSNISHIDVQFAPQILPSSYCNKTAEQLNCSCETVGNPSPTSQWYLDGLPVNHSDKFAISSESVKDTSVRSIISVNRPQWKGLSTLSCLSSNSQGSVRQPFYVYVLEPQTCAESHDKVTLYAFITTVAALLVLVCALLLVIRSQRIHHNLPQNTVAMTQLLTSGEGNEIPNATEEDIYANVQRQGDVAYCAAIAEVNSPNFPSSGPNNVEGVNTSSEKKEEGSGVIYSGVNWKSKSKRRKEEVAGDMDQPGSSYLAEERCMLGGTCRSFMSNAMELGNLYDEAQPRNVNKGMECEYAQVKFKSKSVKK